MKFSGFWLVWQRLFNPSLLPALLVVTDQSYSILCTISAVYLYDVNKFVDLSVYTDYFKLS